MTRPRQNKPYELVRHTSPVDGETFVEGFAAHAVGVTRTVKQLGGFWMMEWDFPLEGSNTLDYLESEWFNSAIFHRIFQRLGGSVVWKGVVWTMELTHPSGIKLRRKYEDIWNAVKMEYLDTAGDNQETDWYEDDASIALYGRREYRDYISDATAEMAEAKAQRILREYKMPWARNVRTARDMEPGLYVMAAGDIWTANNRYAGATTLDDATGDISAYVSSIIENDCDFVSAVHIQENTVQATRSQTMPVRAWDLISKLVEDGDDAEFNRWEALMDAGGFVYRKADTTPTLYWYADKGVTDRAKKSGPEVYWAMMPGVMRAHSLGVGQTMPGSPLQDSRDSWIVEVQMSDDYDEPNLKSEHEEPEDIVASQRGLIQRASGRGVDPERRAELLGEADDILGGGFYG